MRRTFVMSLLLLILATGGMLFWQWNVYSEGQEQLGQDKLPIVQQHVQIQHNQNELKVIHTISNLKKGTYAIKNPLNVEYVINGKKSNHRFLTVNDNEAKVEFQYSIPFDANSSSTLLLDWAIQLENVEMSLSEVEITVTSNRTGSWAAASKQMGKAKKENIDYYVFKREGAVFPLYYQEGELNHQSLDNGLIIYYEDYSKLDVDQLSSLFTDFPELKDRVVLFTSKHQEIVWTDLIMLNDTKNMDRLEKKLSFLYVDALFPFKEATEKWQQNILADLYKGKQLGGAKTVTMMEELEQNLTEEEVNSFLKRVLRQNQLLSTAILDEILSSVKGLSTSFFSLNKEENKPVVPLYFSDQRIIVIDGQRLQSSMIYYKGQSWMPLMDIVEKAGYSYSIMNDGHVLLTKDSDSLRLYPEKNVFILNGVDYSVPTNPVTALKDELYIQEGWITDIFDFKVMKEEGRITISTY